MRLTELKLKPYARLAAMGALGVSAGSLGLFLFIALNSRPVALGGLDQTQAIVSWISLAVPFALIIGAHLVYARVLMKYAKE
jgi:hypothetical protein